MEEITENLRDINTALGGDRAVRKASIESIGSIGKHLTNPSIVLGTENARESDTANGERAHKKSSTESLRSVRKHSSVNNFLIPTETNEAKKEPDILSARMPPVDLLGTARIKDVNESPYESRRGSRRSQSVENLSISNKNSIYQSLRSLGYDNNGRRISFRVGEAFPNLKKESAIENAKTLNPNRSSIILATSQKRIVEVKKVKIPNFEVRIVRKLNDSASEKMRTLNRMEPSLGISKEIFMSDYEKKAYEKMRQEIRDMIEAKPIRGKPLAASTTLCLTLIHKNSGF